MKWFFAVLSLLTFVSAAGEIKVAPDASNAEKNAAKDLRSCYEKVTGTRIGDSPYVFYLGKAAAGAAWFKPEKTRFEEWVIESRNNEVVITGDIRGTVWGVYEFIEKYLGCDFLASDTEIIPSVPGWSLPKIRERFKPAFMRREMSSAAPRLNTQQFRLRRKESVRTPYPEIRMHHGSPHGSHTFVTYVREWPENAPRGGDGMSPCYSSPEAVRLFVEQLGRYIEKDRKNKPREEWPILYDISQNDGWDTTCKCRECRRISKEEGSVSGANLRFVNAVAERIAKDYPEILVQTFAYQNTQQPPKITRAGKNVLVRTCNSEITAPLLPGTPQGEILEGWVKMAPKLGLWSYWKPYSGEETPYIKPRAEMQKEMQYCRDKGILTYFAENEDPYVRSFYALQYYLWSKLAVDPDCDVEKLTDRFLAGYYGKAAPVMRKYLEYLEKREKEVPYLLRGNMYCFLDADFFSRSNAMLEQAESLVRDDPRSLRHVRWERVPVDHAMLMRQGKIPMSKEEKNATVRRWRANAGMVLENFMNDWVWRKKNLASRLAELDNEEKLFRAMPFEVPKQFQGKTINDLHWPDFDPWGVHARYLVDDPEASSGRAFTLRKGIDPGRHKRKKLHELPLSFGVHDDSAPKGKEFVSRFYWNSADIPQDEKYHWVRLGKAPITRNMRIYVHWSWGLRIFMRSAMTGIDLDRPKEIWMSMKVTGPTYVKNSGKPDGIFVDRVILVSDQD